MSGYFYSRPPPGGGQAPPRPVFQGDPRMTPFGLIPYPPGHGPLPPFGPPTNFRPPLDIISPPPPGHVYQSRVRPRRGSKDQAHDVLPIGVATGDPRSIPHPPPGFSRPPPYPPHHPSALLPPVGMNICSVGLPGTYFHLPTRPMPDPNFPLLRPPSVHVGVSFLGPRGPNVPLLDATDVFIAKWLETVTANRDEDLVQEDRAMKLSLPPAQVPEARGLLSHALGLLSSLRQCQAQLAGLRGGGEEGGEQWTTTMTQVQRWKEELLAIRGLVERGNNVQRLSRKLAGIKKKRVKKREAVKRRRKERDEERDRRERRAEQWVQQRRQEKLKEETERSVQADAGGLLGEVRRKLSDVQHCLKLVTILKELREHKRETHKKSGEPPLVREDEFFSSTTSELSELLNQRVSLYEEEEHALRVMVREEVEERMLAESAAKEAAESKLREGEGAKEAEEGGEGERGGEVAECVDPFSDYYLQAENSVEALVGVRRGWDVYISEEGSPLPSQLPQSQPPPASSHWAQYCDIT